MTFRGYWDAHEEDLLRRGVQKHGIGSWERIRHDPDFKILKCVCRRARLAGQGTGWDSTAASPVLLRVAPWPSSLAVPSDGRGAHLHGVTFRRWLGAPDAACPHVVLGACLLAWCRQFCCVRPLTPVGCACPRRRLAGGGLACS